MSVILLSFYKRKECLTREEFIHHWHDLHGPLIRSLPELKGNIVRYVQHHITTDCPFPVPDNIHLDYDGFSETWWKDLKSLNSVLSQGSVREKLEEQESQFLSSKFTLLLDKQKVIISGVDDENIKSAIETVDPTMIK